MEAVPTRSNYFFHAQFHLSAASSRLACIRTPLHAMAAPLLCVRDRPALGPVHSSCYLRLQTNLLGSGKLLLANQWGTFDDISQSSPTAHHAHACYVQLTKTSRELHTYNKPPRATLGPPHPHDGSSATRVPGPCPHAPPDDYRTYRMVHQWCLLPFHSHNAHSDTECYRISPAAIWTM